MQRREFIKVFIATAISWPRSADAETKLVPLRASSSQPTALTQAQLGALAAYNKALNQFKSILSERHTQISSHQSLPNLPGQALYLARVNVMSAYKDLSDALPSKIGRDNKFGIPPAYFDADIEPLVDEHGRLFDIMERPPANAQNSDTPFKDVVDLGIAIARAKGLAATHAEVAGRISLGLFFAETNGKQNVGNARSNAYKGSLQTGPLEDRAGQKKWATITEKTDCCARVEATTGREKASVDHARSPVVTRCRDHVIKARRDSWRACALLCNKMSIASVALARRYRDPERICSLEIYRRQ